MSTQEVMVENFARGLDAQQKKAACGDGFVNFGNITDEEGIDPEIPAYENAFQVYLKNGVLNASYRFYATETERGENRIRHV